MNVIVNKKEKSQVELEFTIDSKEFNERLDKVFVKNAKHFKVPGFRPGKAPRATIEKLYGEDSLNYSVIEEYVDEDFRKAVEENNIEIVGKPALNVVKVDKTQGAIYTVTFDVKPETTVKEYKGLTIEYKPNKVTKKEVDAELEKLREKNSRQIAVENRALENGDVSNIDFEGFIDGTAFEGGKAEKFDLTIGSNQFIPGFEEQMIGMKIGEQKEITVTFPSDYHAENLAGKQAIFKVTLHTISKKELPVLDDDFAKDVSEFDNLKDYTANVQQGLEKKVEAENKATKETAVLDKLLEQTVVEIPSSMIEEQVENLMKQTEMELSYQGMNLETYCQYLGLDVSVMKQNYKMQAEKDVKLKLALEAIEKLEKVEVSKEEIETKIEQLAKSYGEDKADSFKNNENIIHYITEQLKQEKLIHVIVDSAIVK